MIKIAHEAPNAIFEEVSTLTDIDYALVHLFEENQWYWNNFKKSVEKGREVILDNSIFELGTAFDSDRYADWICEINPTWYIIPDVLEDGFATIQSFTHFKHKFEGLLPGKTIAVAQGKTFYEMLFCFEFLHNDPFVDMVALSFDLSFYESMSKGLTNLQRWMLGRQYLIKHLDQMYRDGYFNKKVHLLGTALPQEGVKYKHMDWIYSVDTSNPVMHGLEYNSYDDWGIATKSKTKLYTIINDDVNDLQLDNIKYNISEFRKFWRHNEDVDSSLFPFWN